MRPARETHRLIGIVAKTPSITKNGIGIGIKTPMNLIATLLYTMEVAHEREGEDGSWILNFHGHELLEG